MNFDIRLLEAFLAVCDTGGITKAAETVHVSQPALTRRMQELEKLFDAKLFKRTKKGIELTEAGFHLQVRAREIVDMARRTAREMQEMAGEIGAVVRIGVVETNAAPFIAEKIAQWKTLRPSAQFEVYGADGDDIRRELDQGNLDMAVLLEPIESAKYDSVLLPEAERWGVVVRKESGPERRTITLEELQTLELILPRRHIVREVLNAWFGKYARDIKIAGWHNIPTNALELARRGLGALLCVEGSYRMREAEDLVFIPIAPERTSAQRLVRRRNHKLLRPAEDFWNLCSEDIAGS